MSWALEKDRLLYAVFGTDTKFGYCEVKVSSYGLGRIGIEYSFNSPQNVEKLVKAIRSYLKNIPHCKIEEIIRETIVKRRFIGSGNYNVSKILDSYEIIVSFEFSEREKRFMEDFLKKFENFIGLKVRDLT